MAESLTKDLQDLMECGICLETMTEPRMLTCQHSFCCSCLESLDDKSPSLGITCPTCRCVTTLSEGGVANLPPDFKLNTLSEMITKSGSQATQEIELDDREVELDDMEVELDDTEVCYEQKISEVVNQPEKKVCAVCPEGKSGKVKWFCKDCLDHMCKPCGNKHKQTPIFSSHELIHTPDSEWSAQKCNKHPQKSEEYYCVECKVLACSVCVTNQHRKHQIHDIVERAKECLREIDMKTCRMDAVYEESVLMNADEKEMRQFHETVNKTISDIAVKVEQCAAETMKKVEKEKSRLLASLERDRMSFNKRFQSVQAASVKSEVQEMKEKCRAYSKSKELVDLLVCFENLSLNIEKSISDILESDREATAFLSFRVPAQFNEARQKVLIGSVVRSEEIRSSKLFPHPLVYPSAPTSPEKDPAPSEEEPCPLDSLFRTPSLSSLPLSEPKQSHPKRGHSRGRPPHTNRGHSQERSPQQYPMQHPEGQGQEQGGGRGQGRGHRGGRGQKRGHRGQTGQRGHRGQRGGQGPGFLLPDPFLPK